MTPTVQFSLVDPKSGLPLPQYTTSGAAGADIRSSEDVLLEPGQTKVVKTGLRCAVPEGYEIQVRSRSGLAAKHGVFVTNGIGTIDSDYRGELMVILSNIGRDDLWLNTGERIAQIVVSPAQQAKFELVDELSLTVRGDGGLGSTGV